jgi:hypothetical protein
MLHVAVLALVAVLFSSAATAQSFAPGFSALPRGAKVAFMPSDIELYSISAGGVPEPKADWTEAAQKNLRQALTKKTAALGLTVIEVPDAALDELAELNALHTAVARAIVIHHLGPAHLPTKGGSLDWSLGEAARAAKKATGADYALYTWIRDSYASAERQAAIAAIAVLTLGRAAPGGGVQNAYASLVDLNTGRVLWFNRIQRASGDLREADRAEETLDALLARFPSAK